MSIKIDDPGPMIAARVAAERSRRNWSLADLASRSGVSKAMLSRIEREEVSATAIILSRVATAFGLTLAEMLAASDAEQRFMRAKDQPTWRDPKTGYLRRQVFLSARNPLELVEVDLPTGASVAFPASAYARVRHVYWVLSGRLTVLEGDREHELAAGDRLELGPPQDVTLRNQSQRPCRYVVALMR